jgi:16S rRNA (guanine527-N7)-methyltransferase
MTSQDVNVSRETLDDLGVFHDLVLKWNPHINLVSKSSVGQLWDRHIWDSAQVVDMADSWKNWVDIGSGGGFPGLVVAILAKHAGHGQRVTLIESDARKCAFLRAVIRDLSLDARVLTERVESCPPQNADVLSARALTDLPGLLAFAERHLAPTGTALFLKGETWEKEVRSARDSWSFSMRVHKSKTNPAAAVLEMKDIARV